MEWSIALSICQVDIGGIVDQELDNGEMTLLGGYVEWGLAGRVAPVAEERKAVDIQIGHSESDFKDLVRRSGLLPRG